MTAPLRVLVADDEPLAREWVRRQLEADADVELVGEAEDGFAAVEAIERLEPDLVFLDVEMPGLDGFGVLETLTRDPLPAVVFITAFDRYAAKAFDADALDYVVKPFSRARFRKALQKAKARHSGGAPGPDREALRSRLRGSGRYLDWLLVKTGDRSVFVRVRDVDWIESARNNVILHVEKRAHTFAGTMKGMEEALDPSRFLRIHRSTIVNLERVRELQPWFNGDYRVLLRDGQELTLSAGYRASLARFRRLPE